MANAKDDTTKCIHVFGMDGASLHLRQSGYGEDDGSGYFVFDEEDVQWLPHDEREGSYLEVKLARSEMVELRDFLLRQYPLEATNDVPS